MYQPTDDELSSLAAIAPMPDVTPPPIAPDFTGGVMPPPNLSGTAMPPPVSPPMPPPTAPASGAPAPAGSQPGMSLFATQVAQSESGNNPKATNPNSTASGRFQITDPTLTLVLKNHPELQGIPDPKNDARVQAAINADNQTYLEKSLGRTPNHVDLIAAWFLGPAGATRFLQAYEKDPNMQIDRVVGQDALQANHKVFYNADGSAKTVGEVYAMEAKKVGELTAGGGTGSSGGTAPNAPANPYSQQQSDISDYIKGQPAMWQKLGEMQQAYLKSAKPTLGESMGDIMSKMSMQQAANNALMHSNAGGILLHADPDNSQYIKALQSSHDIDAATAAQRQATAKTAYELGAGTIAAQNEQGAKNLGLTGDVTKNILADQNTKQGLGIQQQEADTQKAGLTIQQQNADTTRLGLNIQQQNADTERMKAAAETALQQQQAGVTQQKAFSDFLEKAVPNPDTRAKIVTEMGNTSTGSLADNIKAATALIGKHQTAGDPIAVREPGQMFEVITPDANGNAQRTVINGATPEGQKLLQALPANAKVTALGAPQTNITQNAGGGGGGTGGGEGGGAATTAQQHLQAIQTKQAAEAALALLPYVSAHGGTGVLTDSPEGKAVASKLRQVTGIDYSGLPVREVYDKLMQQVQLGLVLPQMKQMGARPAQTEFQQLMAGQLGATSTTEAARAFLTHVSKTMDWTQRKIEELNSQAAQARQNNNVYFDPTTAEIQWQSKPGNQPPVWDGGKLIDSVKPPTASPGPAGNQPNTGPKLGARQTLNGRVMLYDGTNWVWEEGKN